MSKQFWAVIVVIVLVLVGVFIATSHKSGTSSMASSGQTTNHVEGEGKTGVALVEYGDYECPYCEEYAPVVAQVAQQYNTQITFQFRNFPLVSIHPNAFAGARAAEAAGLEGKFWQMHDALYTGTNWQVWSTSSDPTPYFDQYATEIGLNLTTFKTDFASSKVNDLINADEAAGNKLGIQGTPAFYLDGKAVDGTKLVDDSDKPSVAAFSKVIDAAIASKTSTTTSTAQTTK